MKVLGGSVLVACLVLCASPAVTHTRSASYSLWSVTRDTDSTRAHVVVQIPQLELTRLPWGPVTPPRLDPALARYLSSRLVLSAAGKPCAVRDGPRALAATPGNARFEWEVACESPAPLEIGSNLLLEVASSHLHFARIGQGFVIKLHQANSPWACDPIACLRDLKTYCK